MRSCCLIDLYIQEPLVFFVNMDVEKLLICRICPLKKCPHEIPQKNSLHNPPECRPFLSRTLNISPENNRKTFLSLLLFYFHCIIFIFFKTFSTYTDTKVYLLVIAAKCRVFVRVLVNVVQPRLSKNVKCGLIFSCQIIFSCIYTNC